MRMLLGRRTAASDFIFFSLTLGVWCFLLILAAEAATASSMHVAFVTIASFIALIIFKAYVTFDSFRVAPRQSDAIIMTAAWMLGGLGGESILHLAWHSDEVTRLMPLFMKNIPIAFACYGIYGAYLVLAPKYERPKNVALWVTTRQRAILLQEFALLQTDFPVDFVSEEQLHKRVMAGNARSVDLIVISRENASRFDTEAVLLRAHLAGTPIADYQDVLRRITRRVRLSETDLSSYLLQASEKTFLCRLLLQLKHLAEPIFACMLLILFSPLLIGVAAAIKVYSPGPIFYVQNRTGYLGKQFKLIKFRSMRTDAERDGPQWAAREDDRVTPIGKLLRRTRLDELPQFWNVMRGEMSFFGPRPERPEIYQMIQNEVPLFSLRTLVRPGVTGWAQVCAGYAASVAESALKLEYDLYYIQHMSLRLDFAILLKTLKVAVYGERQPVRAPAVRETSAVEQT